MEMISLLTGGQRELTSFCSQSYLCKLRRCRICNSISLKSGLLALYFSQQYLTSWWTMWKNPLWVSSLRETEENKRERYHVSLCGDHTLPVEMMQYTALCRQWGSSYEENRWASAHPKYATAIGGWKLLNIFLGGQERRSPWPLKMPVDG